MTQLLKEKYNLTIKEASQYFNIGENKIRELAKQPLSDFTLYVGKKILIKREQFEKYLENNIYL